jgi:cell division protein FtsB
MRPKTRNRLVLLLAVVLAVPAFFGVKALLAQQERQKGVAEELAKLEQEVNTGSNKNQELARSLTYLRSSAYKERIAHEELNLKEEGEIVFNIPEGQLGATSTTPIRYNEKQEPAWILWWNYFFN